LINNKDELTSKEKPTEEGKEQKKVKTKRLISDLFTYRYRRIVTK
jgi:hypothetical protein